MENEKLKNFLYHYNLLDQKDVVLELVNKYKDKKIRFYELIDLLSPLCKIDFTKFNSFIDELIILAEEAVVNSSVKVQKNLEPHTLKQNIIAVNISDFIGNIILSNTKKEEEKIKLKNIIINFLKDRKGDLAIYEKLITPIKDGGIGFSANQAQTFLKDVKNINNIYQVDVIQKYLNISSPQIQTQKIEDLSIDVKDNVKLPKYEGFKPTYNHVKGVRELTNEHNINEPFGIHVNKHIKSIERMKELRPAGLSKEVIGEIEETNMHPINQVKLQTPVIPKAISQLIENELPVKPLKQQTEESTETINSKKETPREMVYASHQANDERPMMSDIKHIPKTVGPIEELAGLTLVDFRRLANTPNDAVNAIMNKLQLLENDSMLKRNEGIQALKSSLLYKVYSDIMQSSLLQGTSLEESISKQSEIAKEEFYAIMNLNRKLRV